MAGIVIAFPDLKWDERPVTEPKDQTENKESKVADFVIKNIKLGNKLIESYRHISCPPSEESKEEIKAFNHEGFQKIHSCIISMPLKFLDKHTHKTVRHYALSLFGLGTSESKSNRLFVDLHFHDIRDFGMYTFSNEKKTHSVILLTDSAKRIDQYVAKFKSQTHESFCLSLSESKIETGDVIVDPYLQVAFHVKNEAERKAYLKQLTVKKLRYLKGTSASRRDASKDAHKTAKELINQAKVLKDAVTLGFNPVAAE